MTNGPALPPLPCKPRPSRWLRCSHDGRRGRGHHASASAGLDTDGQAVCSHCGSLDGLRVPPPVRCAALALQGLQARISRITSAARCSPRTSCRCAATSRPSPIFCNEVKGKSMLALSPRSRPVLQDGVRALPQDARGDGRGNEGPPDRRRPPRGGSRWRLLRRLREAREPERGSRGSPLAPRTNPASARSSS